MTTQIDMAVIDSVQADGRLNVVLDGQLVTGVPCLQSVRDRTAGMRVLVARTEVGLVALGPTTGQDWTLPTLVEAPPIPTVQWGDGPPAGMGWQEMQAASVQQVGLWVRDDGDGSTSTYFQRRLEQQSQPPSSTPKPKTSPVPADDWQAYRSGRTDRDDADGGPRQASYNSVLGDWSGAWLWRGLTAPAGATGIRLRLERSAASNGISGGARVRIFLSNATDLPPRPPSRHTPWSPGSLARGQRTSPPGWLLPAAWFDHIRVRTSVVIVCHATSSSESIIYRPNATLQYVI